MKKSGMKIFSLLVASLFLFSCSDDVADAKRDENTASVSPKKLTFSYDRGDQVIIIESSAQWLASTEDGWIILEKESGDGLGHNVHEAIGVSVEKNLGDKRSGSVTVETSSGDFTVEIIQTGIKDLVSVTPASLAFGSENSTNTISLTTLGDWSVSSEQDWLSFDKTSDNSEDIANAEVITVTAQVNNGEARAGVIIIKTVSGNFTVTVTQEGAVLEYGTLNFIGVMVKDGGVTTNKVAIPYSKAQSGGAYIVKATITGAGSAGVVASDLSGTFDAQEGVILFPIGGTPTSAGEVSISIVITSYLGEVAPMVVNSVVIADKILFFDQFDGMIWGGDCVGQLPGIKGSFKNDPEYTAEMGLGTRIVDESKPINSCALTVLGSGGLFETMSPNYRILRGLAKNWMGSKFLYERPGYIQLNSTSKAGDLKSHAFSTFGLPEGANGVQLALEFKFLQMFDEKTEEGYLEVLIDEKGEKRVVTKIKMAAGEVNATWEQGEVVIDNVTSSSLLIFKVSDDSVATAPDASIVVVLLDDIKLSVKVD